MYCPNCGQQQAYEHVRFCSRCGLLLDGLKQWLDGVPSVSQLYLVQSPKHRTGVTQGAKLMFLSVVLLPMAFALGIWREVDSPAPLLVPFTIFLIGLTRMIYSRIFEEESALERRRAQRNVSGEVMRNAVLPPPRIAPVSVDSPRTKNTGEDLRPPSITEHTTNLLENED